MPLEVADSLLPLETDDEGEDSHDISNCFRAIAWRCSWSSCASHSSIDIFLRSIRVGAKLTYVVFLLFGFRGWRVVRSNEVWKVNDTLPKSRSCHVALASRFTSNMASRNCLCSARKFELYDSQHSIRDIVQHYADSNISALILTSPKLQVIVH